MQDTKNKESLAHDPTQSSVAKVIDWSVNNKLLVVAFMITLLVAGIFAIKNLD